MEVEEDITPLPTANFRGQYELFAIVTHKGRSANGGHYIGWTKKAKFSDQWYKFDDDEVTKCKVIVHSCW